MAINRLIHSQNMAKENTVMMTDCVMISNAAPVACLFGFAFSEKPLIFSTRGGIFYGWWWCWRSVTSPNMVAMLDFIKH